MSEHRTTIAGFLAGIACFTLGSATVSATDDDRAGTEFFETRVRPLFVEHCGKCHGERRQRSGLRLDSISAILRGGERGPAIVPGDPDESRLIRAIRYTDEDLQMPERGKLPDELIADLEARVAAHEGERSGAKVLQTAT